jgi:hypothetical protein
MDRDRSDAAGPAREPADAVARELARELLPRLRRWDSASWSLPAQPPAQPPVHPPVQPPAKLSGAPPAEPPAELAAGARQASGRAGTPTRAEVAAAVLQRLADAGADAEGLPRRPVPLLADVNLADQLAVVIEDILRAGDPAALRTAATELAALRAALGYR